MKARLKKVRIGINKGEQRERKKDFLFPSLKHFSPRLDYKVIKPFVNLCGTIYPYFTLLYFTFREEIRLCALISLFVLSGPHSTHRCQLVKAAEEIVQDSYQLLRGTGAGQF